MLVCALTTRYWTGILWKKKRLTRFTHISASKSSELCSALLNTFDVNSKTTSKISNNNTAPHIAYRISCFTILIIETKCIIDRVLFSPSSHISCGNSISAILMDNCTETFFPHSIFTDYELIFCIELLYTVEQFDICITLKINYFHHKTVALNSRQLILIICSTAKFCQSVKLKKKTTKCANKCVDFFRAKCFILMKNCACVRDISCVKDAKNGQNLNKIYLVKFIKVATCVQHIHMTHETWTYLQFIETEMTERSTKTKQHI